jgi:hypothetical protein
MKYNYTIESGLTRIKTNTKKYAASALASIGIAGAIAMPALAAKPTNPGCFGRDRAAWLSANSGQEWGAIAPTRAGDNGAINQAYKTRCGGDSVNQ